MAAPFAEVIINVSRERHDSSLGAGGRGKRHARGGILYVFGYQVAIALGWMRLWALNSETCETGTFAAACFIRHLLFLNAHWYLCKNEQHLQTQKSCAEEVIMLLSYFSSHTTFDNVAVIVASLILIYCITNTRWACWTHSIHLSLNAAYIAKFNTNRTEWGSLLYLLLPFQCMVSIFWQMIKTVLLQCTLENNATATHIYDTLHAIIYRMWLSISSAYTKSNISSNLLPQRQSFSTQNTGALNPKDVKVVLGPTTLYSTREALLLSSGVGP